MLAMIKGKSKKDPVRVRMHSAKYWEAGAPPWTWKPGSIQVLGGVGVLDCGGEGRAAAAASLAGAKAGREGKAMPYAAKAGAKANGKGKAAAGAGSGANGKGKAMPPTAAKAGAKAEAKAKAKAKKWMARIPEEPAPKEPDRRWVHIHWHKWPIDDREFYVHRESTVGELLPKIAEWYRLDVSQFSIWTDRRLIKDTRWKACGAWDIEVTLVENGTVYIVENGMSRYQ
jgi:hypothetical protein